MIGILGAGALGRLWAALLPEHQSCFLPRPDTDPAASPVRYTFQNLDGKPTTITRPWLTLPTDISLLLVTTKAGDTVEALDSWLPHISSKVPVLLLQNGLGSQQAVAEHWPDRPILAASTTEGANRPTPDQLKHAGQGDTWIGPLTSAAAPLTERVVESLQPSGLRIHCEQDILPRLWQKLVINAGINPFTALLNCPNGDILDNDFFQQKIIPLCAEIAQLMSAEGIEGAAPEELRNRIENVARATARNTSSMRADTLAGRCTEIDFINGYLVRLGQKLGIPTPVNQLLTHQVKQLSP
ncbi:ketopantoate reductase family protein [Marinobacter salinexigens]|uniref:2-dehydropantoate 2-reductase n=1 Tax=Marinobacter salinexigens TaxID=2919747 RepID=A0A5B0VIE2_9GAMM|nr:ketopantoate reductase family protein [Marinobacter salinexigens]KAA1173751.1 ketopantoate reductase family protein [Marinobacter salinexigens]